MSPTEILATRNRKGWTQQGLADALGVSVRTVKHWEAGTRNISPPVEKLLKLITYDFMGYVED
jgi:DNA-binding transcriptional regulator YiaG